MRSACCRQTSPVAGHAAPVCNPGSHPPAAAPDHRLARLWSWRRRLHPGNPSTDPQLPPFWMFRLSSGASVQPARPAHTQPAESKPLGVQQAAKGTSAPARVARHCHTSLIERNLPPGSSSCTQDGLWDLAGKDKVSVHHIQPVSRACHVIYVSPVHHLQCMFIHPWRVQSHPTARPSGFD